MQALHQTVVVKGELEADWVQSCHCFRVVRMLHRWLALEVSRPTELGGVDPEPTGKVMDLIWFGNASRSPRLLGGSGKCCWEKDA